MRRRYPNRYAYICPECGQINTDFHDVEDGDTCPLCGEFSVSYECIYGDDEEACDRYHAEKEMD